MTSLDVDPAQLEQLLINLLKNAHESESAPNKITVEVAEQHQEYILKVSDRGKGIDESRLNSACKHLLNHVSLINEQ